MLSPSSAERWINCPPSALLNAQAEDKGSPWAAEGTLAHAVAEVKARKYLLGGIGPKKYEITMKNFRADPLWQDEMDGHTDYYLECIKTFAAAFRETPHAAVEQRLDMSAIIPGCFGTADCILVGGGVLHVIDFKYGRGVPVSAEGNAQMMLYALGALKAYELIYDIDYVNMSIVQPRVKDEPDTALIKAEDLRAWAETVVKPAAALAAKGEGVFQEGDWCRFCAVRATCRARAEKQLALARNEFKSPALLSDAEIGKALEDGRRLKDWLGDVEEYALGACLDGREIPGWKAVEGRSTRAWTDVNAAFEAARAAGVPDTMLYECKPLTLAAVEKLMGKRTFADVLGGFVAKPQGKPALAPADDKRPAYTARTTAQEDFTKEPEELPFN